MEERLILELLSLSCLKRLPLLISPYRKILIPKIMIRSEIRKDTGKKKREIKALQIPNEISFSLG